MGCARVALSSTYRNARDLQRLREMPWPPVETHSKQEDQANQSHTPTTISLPEAARTEREVSVLTEEPESFCLEPDSYPAPPLTFEDVLGSFSQPSNASSSREDSMASAEKGMRAMRQLSKRWNLPAVVPFDNEDPQVAMLQ